MVESVLAVEGLTVVRGPNTVVENVSFTICAGTDTAIVGPNGAGKSTLVQAILGILPHQSGQVQVLGTPLSVKGWLPMGCRQHIAYLPQNFLVDRRIPLTVGELVGLGWGGREWEIPWLKLPQRRRAVHQALVRVHASHLYHQSIGHLSGGEIKRVLLAYCLVFPRRLLILDEAPAGLDVRGEADFYDLLYQLKREEDWAILQISHDLDMVRRHCDQVLCLNRRLLCQGTPDVALAPETLALAYGTEFVQYRHTH